MVLANRPGAVESRQMLAFGATACLSKSSEARDVLHAIHLASRGLHVLPSVDPACAPPPGPDVLTPARSR
jgi:DNA-binding NarL/FixJ family response regulator